jgi:hypothetical protein
MYYLILGIESTNKLCYFHSTPCFHTELEFWEENVCVYFAACSSRQVCYGFSDLTAILIFPVWYSSNAPYKAAIHNLLSNKALIIWNLENVIFLFCEWKAPSSDTHKKDTLTQWLLRSLGSNDTILFDPVVCLCHPQLHSSAICNHELESSESTERGSRKAAASRKWTSHTTHLAPVRPTNTWSYFDPRPLFIGQDDMITCKVAKPD